jgi:hypothetical protein
MWTPNDKATRGEAAHGLGSSHHHTRCPDAGCGAKGFDVCPAGLLGLGLGPILPS